MESVLINGITAAAYQQGSLKRVVAKYPNGDTIERIYRFGRIEHETKTSGYRKETRHYKNGVLHSLIGPAVSIEEEEFMAWHWYVDGLRHSATGPAIVEVIGPEESRVYEAYYIRGKPYDRKKFESEKAKIQKH